MPFFFFVLLLEDVSSFFASSFFAAESAVPVVEAVDSASVLLFVVPVEFVVGVVAPSVAGAAVTEFPSASFT